MKSIQFGQDHVRLLNGGERVLKMRTCFMYGCVNCYAKRSHDQLVNDRDHVFC